MRIGKFFIISAAVAVTGLLTLDSALADDWPFPRNNAQLTNATFEAMPVPLALAWEFDGGSSPGNESQPAVVGDTVVFAAGNAVYAVDTTTGGQKWRYPSDPNQNIPASVNTSLTIHEGRVFFGGSDGDLYVLSLASGTLVGVYPTQGSVRSSATVANDRLYFGSADNALHSINPVTQEPYWLGGFRTRDDVQSTPAFSSGMVFFISRDTYLYVANESGKLLWTYRIPVPTLNVVPVISGNSLFIAAGNTLTSMGTRSGYRNWQLLFPGEITASPALANQTLYVPVNNGKLYALSTLGKLKWESSADTVHPLRAAPVVAGDTVIAAAERGIISAFDAETGSLLWRYTLPGRYEANRKRYNNVEASPVWANGTLFVLPDDGVLRAFKPEAPDQVPPEYSGLTPIPGTPVSGSPPLRMGVTIQDRGSGIDPASVKLLLDGEETESEYNIATGEVTYATPYEESQVPLTDGRHEIRIVARDWVGNELNFGWSFVVDNSLPKPRVIRRAPTPRATPESPAPPSPDGRGGDRWRDRDGDVAPPPPPPPPPAPGPGGPTEADMVGEQPF